MACTELDSLELCLDGNFADPAMEQALSQILLAEVRRGERAPLLRLTVTRPLVSFGAEELRNPRLPAAAAAARARGHIPTLRHSGGQAIVFGPTILLFAAITRTDPAWSPQDRFSAVATRIAAGLGALGLAAEVGPVPGEYCPGAFSIHVGPHKVVGMAQRISLGAACTEGMIVVSADDAIRATLSEVYAALGHDWDPATAGDLGGPSVDEVTAAVIEAFQPDARAEVGEVTLASARERARRVAIPTDLGSDAGP